MGGAAVPEPSGKGKKKALDAIVNVVPFIDLLSCCLSFLLITAVWTQVAKLQVSQSGGPSDAPPPPDKTLQLSLTITDKGFTLAAGQGGNVVDVPKKGIDYDVGALFDKLKEIKNQYPDQNTITVAAEDSVQYNDLVQTIDTCIKAGLASVSVQAVT
jgi:biopolymer transport protein TolR